MLHPGLYEQVINNALTSELAEIPEACKSVAPIDKAEASKVLAQYLADVVQKGLDNVLDNGGDISAQIGLTNQIVELIQNTTQEADFAAQRDLAAIDGKLNQEKALNIHQAERLETIREIYEQQKYMYDNHTHSVENRIVSVSQPFVRPIMRGKAGKPVEFGMKLDISVTDGWTRLEYRSFDAYNEATKLQEMIENFHKREGHYPSRVLVDKIYRNRENLSYCKERGIRLSGPALGRPKKGEDRNKAQDYRDECERVEVERKFSLGKRKCGMGLVTAKLEETAAHVVALSILLLNLRKIRCAFLRFWDWLLGFLQSREKQIVIQ